jgi:hypothetical protein
MSLQGFLSSPPLLETHDGSGMQGSGQPGVRHSTTQGVGGDPALAKPGTKPVSKPPGARPKTPHAQEGHARLSGVHAADAAQKQVGTASATESSGFPAEAAVTTTTSENEEAAAAAAAAAATAAAQADVDQLRAAMEAARHEATELREREALLAAKLAADLAAERERMATEQQRQAAALEAELQRERAEKEALQRQLTERQGAAEESAAAAAASLADLQKKLAEAEAAQRELLQERIQRQASTDAPTAVSSVAAAVAALERPRSQRPSDIPITSPTRGDSMHLAALERERRQKAGEEAQAAAIAARALEVEIERQKLIAKQAMLELELERKRQTQRSGLGNRASARPGSTSASSEIDEILRAVENENSMVTAETTLAAPMTDDPPSAALEQLAVDAPVTPPYSVAASPALHRAQRGESLVPSSPSQLVGMADFIQGYETGRLSVNLTHTDLPSFDLSGTTHVSKTNNSMVSLSAPQEHEEADRENLAEENTAQNRDGGSADPSVAQMEADRTVAARALMRQKMYVSSPLSLAETC